MERDRRITFRHEYEIEIIDMRVCIDCGAEYERKNTKKGRINQCDHCSDSDETVRYIGYNDGTLNKMSHISVYRGNDPNVKKLLLRKNQTAQ